jgi:SP family myo-inositol transporter-like MFS transporter 13
MMAAEEVPVGGVEQGTVKLNTFLITLTFITSISGILFGFDTGVVSGAMLLIRHELSLSDIQQELAVSITMVSAVLGCLLAGKFSILGRRNMIFLSSIIFFVGGVLLGLAVGYNILVAGRVVVGFAIGLASVSAPIYIAEVAPSKWRGTLTMLNTLLITGGQFIAGMVDGLFSETPGGWRFMLGISAVPAFLQLLGCTCLPESPRFLAWRGKVDKAESVLQMIRGQEDVTEEIADILRSLETAPSSSGVEEGHHYSYGAMLSDAPVVRALCLGCGLQALQQLVGINTVMYYAASIYSLAGFADTSAIWLAAFTSLAQMVAVGLGLFLTDRIGRRPQLLVSLFLLSSSLVIMGLSFLLLEITSLPVASADQSCGSTWNIFAGQMATTSCFTCTLLEGCGFCDVGNVCSAASASTTSSSCPAHHYFIESCPSASYGWLSIVGMVMYLFSFGLGMSGLPWVINAEIYPLRCRAMANSTATAVNWLCNILISSTFLSLASRHALALHGAFFLYAAIGFTGFVGLYFTMPETCGLALEEIEDLFAGVVTEGGEPEIVSLLQDVDVFSLGNISDYGSLSVHKKRRLTGSAGGGAPHSRGASFEFRGPQ